jgi:aminomethyltransferase
MSAETCQKTPLHARHIAAGGRLVPFAGFELPVQYSGIIAESKAVRESAGMFDVSHMARLWLRGERVIEFVEHVSANDASKLGDGQGQYSLLPNEVGGTVDDIIVYRVNETTFRMVVNAANHEKDVAWLNTQNTFDLTIVDETSQTAMIAVQGPGALAKVQSICDQPEALASAPLFGLNNVQIGGVACFAPRSGYTGEDGFELICAAEDAERLWDELIGAGVVPCGLGSRDVLRVEAGLPLYGHELTDDLSPIAAGLGWVISKSKPFIGSEEINRVRAEGPPAKLQGIRLESKRVAQPGMGVFISGNQVGSVSSGVYSPALECGIAFAFLDPSVKLETPCSIEIRGTIEPGMVVSKRFVKRDS